MYLDTTILQSRTTTTLIEYIDELMDYTYHLDGRCNSICVCTCDMEHRALKHQSDRAKELILKYENIKKQHRIACKKRGQRIDDDKSQMLEYSETGI